MEKSVANKVDPEQKEKLIQSLKSVELAINDSLGKGIFKSVKQAAILHNCITLLNEHVMGLQVEEKPTEEKKDETNK